MGWFREDNTVRHEFTPDNCADEFWHGHHIDLYVDLPASMLDEIGTMPLTGVRESEDARTGKTRNEYVLDARGLSIKQVAAWVKGWSILGPAGSRCAPNMTFLSKLDGRSFGVLERVVREHAAAAAADRSVGLDPTPAASEERTVDSPTPEPLAFGTTSPEPPTPTSSEQD